MHPIRTCIGCAGRDDHPHHEVIVGDGSSVYWHFDCHAISGCDHCVAQIEGVGGVEGNPKGEKLRAHLTTTGPRPDQPGWTDPSYLTEG